MYLPRLRDLRQDKDKTQTEIGALLGLHQTAYSQYERGDQDLPIVLLVKLADYYNTSADFILGRTDDPTPPKRR